MNQEGPPLQALTHRLSECPPDFLAEPRIGTNGSVHVAAVVFDLIRDLDGGTLHAQAARVFQPGDTAQRNWLRLVLISSWLLHDEWFRTQSNFSAMTYQFLATGLAELSALVEAPQFVNDADRREELARLSLQALGLRPAGESVAQAQDRLTTLSTVVRQRVMIETRAAQERAREIREAMARKAAEEAAAKYNRE